jgi:peptidoglycan biosynthesis protein MviN/MurJ (putative lipid II flippase)
MPCFSLVTLNLYFVIPYKVVGGRKLMWLIILAFAAAIVTPIWYSMAENDKYMLKLLCLILWGATIMVLVDHVMGYLMEGGEFLELTLDATVLGFAMLIAALVIWEIVLILKDPKKVLYRKESE